MMGHVPGQPEKMTMPEAAAPETYSALLLLWQLRFLSRGPRQCLKTPQGPPTMLKVYANLHLFEGANLERSLKCPDCSSLRP